MEKNKNAKIILIAALIIMLCVTIYNVRDSYALFESALNVEAGATAGSWNIYINGSNISRTTTTFVIDNVDVSSNTHVASDKMAPGTSAHFDLNVIPTGTDVSVRYDITFDFSELSTSLTVQSISELNGRTLTRTGENTYSGIILLSEVENDVSSDVRVNILWDNNEANNNVDTIIGRNVNGSISIPVQIVVTQYLGETLVEYE